MWVDWDWELDFIEFEEAIVRLCLASSQEDAKTSKSKMCHNVIGHNYMGHNCIGHTYVVAIPI